MLCNRFQYYPIFFYNHTVETLIISKLFLIDIDSCHIKYSAI